VVAELPPVATGIASVTSEVAALGPEVKELIVLAAIGEHSHPAELADALCIPKPTT
jgi:hypothetical protein